MTRTVSGLFDRYEDAARAVNALEAMNIASPDISLIASNADDFYEDPVGDDAAIGASVGGVGGLLAGLAVVAVPGVGPAIAAGWLASAVVGATGGAVLGAAAGGVVGAMTNAGVAPADANVYAEGVRRGRTLVSATVPDNKATDATEILSQCGALDLSDLRASYEAQGWSRFDENAAPPTVKSLRDYRSGPGA